jgi:chromosome segregation ATPase
VKRPLRSGRAKFPPELPVFKTPQKTYIDSMDDRKKQIDELEQKRRGSRAALDSLFERFGETLLSRAGEAAEPSGTDFENESRREAGEYRRLHREIADSEAAIKTIEEQIRRQRELEDQIALKEQEEGERSKSLAGLYGRLGKAALEADVGGELVQSFQEQAEGLISKVRSLEDRLADLEQKEGNNVFSWIGKSAQSLVLRSFLTKAQDNLEQLYRSVGERFSRQDHSAGDYSGQPEIAGLIAGIEQAREEARFLSKELAELREALRQIGKNFSAEGGPLRQIQTLKNHISRVREELKTLYRCFGAAAASMNEAAETGDSAPERDPFLASLVRADDQMVLDDAERIRQSIRDDERTMEKLRASLAIDEEQAKIEKSRRHIADKRMKIAEAEKDIAEAEDSIKDSEKYIEELRKLL